MSNTIAHLVVAKKILSAHGNMVCNKDTYYLGSIAPDTISSKPGCTRSDKKFVHLRDNIPDAEWLDDKKMEIFNERLDHFAAANICDGSLHRDQIDFNIGYFVHLLTDKWNHKTIRQSLLKIANANGIQENDKAFFDMCVNDLEALDKYLLGTHTEIGSLFSHLWNVPIRCCLSGFIEKDYIEKSMDWWQTKYLPSIETRNLKYISECDIEIFVDLACDSIILELKRYNII